MNKTITFDSEGNDITCMKEFDALEYPCDCCIVNDCPDRETYGGAKENINDYKKDEVESDRWQRRIYGL